MEEDFKIRNFRILLIIKKFSTERLFKSELKLQKLEFFLRNPDHFIYFILKKFLEKKNDKEIENMKEEIDFIVLNPFFKERIVEMKKFKYGAFENLDNNISFLKSIKCLKVIGNNPKIYEITELGETAIKEIESEEIFLWDYKIINMLYKYFKESSPTNLKYIQYESEEYSKALWNKTIKNEIKQVENLYKKVFGESIKL